MNVKRFINHNKGISPIFATLILIAIAVIAGVVVYMFTSGTLATMTGGGSAATEKVAVQGVTYTPGTPNSITVYAQNMGTSSVSATGLLIKNGQGNSIPATFSTSSIAVNELKTLTGTIATLTPGTYTVTLTTANGGSFVSQPFVVS